MASMKIIYVTVLFLCIVCGTRAYGWVLIDSGHSSKFPGAVSCNGYPEYIFNDALARRIASHLENNQVRVGVSHSSGENISLAKRVSLADGADLLLSIHHDSVQQKDLIRESGKQGNCSFRARGFSIFVSRKNPYFTKSLQYAKRIGIELVRRGAKPNLYHAAPINGENRRLIFPDLGIYVYDDLLVIKNTKAPAILLEAGVIVHPEEEFTVQTNLFRDLIAESIYTAIGNQVK